MLPGCAALLLVAASCTLDPVDLSGKACPCAAGWRCEDGVCVSEGGGDASLADSVLVDAAVPADLVLWFPMDDEPDGVVTDASGHGHDATCVPACPSSTAGRVGRAYAMDGATHLVVARDGTLDLETFTLAAWVRPTSTSTDYRGIVARPHLGASSTRNSLGMFHAQQERVIFETAAAATHDTVASPIDTLVLGTWAHVAATFDAAGTKVVYVNGVQVASSSGDPIVYDADDLLVGADHDGGAIDGWLEGDLDDVRVYSRALDRAEIAALASM